MEAVLIVFQYIGILFEKPNRQSQQIIEIHLVLLKFPLGITFVNFLDLFGFLAESAVSVFNQILQGDRKIQRGAEHFQQDVRFGKLFAFGLDLSIFDTGCQQFFGIGTIQNEKVAFESKSFRVRDQDAPSDGVESSAPKPSPVAAGQLADPVHHFPRGFVGKGQQEYRFRWNTFFQQPGDPVDQSTSLAGTGTRDDQRVSIAGGNGCVLLFIELRGIVHLMTRRLLQGV